MAIHMLRDYRYLKRQRSRHLRELAIPLVWLRCRVVVNATLWMVMLSPLIVFGVICSLVGDILEWVLDLLRAFMNWLRVASGHEALIDKRQEWLNRIVRAGRRSRYRDFAEVHGLPRRLCDDDERMREIYNDTITGYDGEE